MRLTKSKNRRKITVTSNRFPKYLWNWFWSSERSVRRLEFGEFVWNNGEIYEVKKLSTSRHWFLIYFKYIESMLGIYTGIVRAHRSSISFVAAFVCVFALLIRYMDFVRRIVHLAWVDPWFAKIRCDDVARWKYCAEPKSTVYRTIEKPL